MANLADNRLHHLSRVHEEVEIVMIKFPKDFVLTDWPGYVWNVTEKALYSYKVTGVLKKLRLRPGFTGMCPYRRQYIDVPAGYEVSVNGKRKRIQMKWLCALGKNFDPDRDQYIQIE